MLYQFFEWNHAAIAPWRAVAEATKQIYQNPLNPISNTGFGRSMAAMAEVFERSTRQYAKPEFGLHETVVDGVRVPVADKPVWSKPFCRLLHFERALPEGQAPGPRFLVVAPMSGHYATLLRGTVEALLPHGEVYITDWEDARKVPVAAGRFDLEDYVDYIVEALHFLGPDTHVIGVCQPAVPVLMAVCAMSMKADPFVPASMTLMGGPIDTRVNPTAVNKLATERGIDWFRNNVIMKVPFPQPGFLRDVYPGFLQLTGFMAMNLDRHSTAHKEFFWHLVKNDGDPAERHRVFYDEYMAVMDLTAEFYLQTVDEVFVKQSLPRGEITHRGVRLDMSAITRTALLTVEGENDDISGLGQTQAAQRLCSALPDAMRLHYVQPDVGHYGVFNGSRFRAEIAPRIVAFAKAHGMGGRAAPADAVALSQKPAPVEAEAPAPSVADTVPAEIRVAALVETAARDKGTLAPPELAAALAEIAPSHHTLAERVAAESLSEPAAKMAPRGRLAKTGKVKSKR